MCQFVGKGIRQQGIRDRFQNEDPASFFGNISFLFAGDIAFFRDFPFMIHQRHPFSVRREIGGSGMSGKFLR